MLQSKYKVSLNPEGRVLIVDPDYELLPFIEKVIPGFEMNSTPAGKGFVPSFQIIKRVGYSDLSVDEISEVNEQELWDIHDKILKGQIRPGIKGDKASLLDIKTELANRALLCCKLCGRQCGINRYCQEGKCGLKSEAYYSSLFTHISEEPVITPALVVKLIGCSLECVHCQAYENHKVGCSKKLDESIWQELEKTQGYREAVSLEFVGGNPDESVAEILWVLNFAHVNFRLPVVWDCNCYGTDNLYRLLEGVVDVWLPDFKFGNDDCGSRISGVPDYWKIARSGIGEMAKQKHSRIIVRIPVLPGHFSCCYSNILEFLKDYRDIVWISISDQYVPEHKAIEDHLLNRTVTPDEVNEVRKLAEIYGLRDIWKENGDFWANG